MSMKPSPIPPIPGVTACVAHAAFPHGHVVMQLRDALGTIYTDEGFADLFPTHGQPAEAPWRLALVTVFQFMEGLTDRQVPLAPYAIGWLAKLLVRSLRTLWLSGRRRRRRRAMSFPDPRIAKVRISKDASLGATMSKMRIWLDKQKIQPARWDAMVDAKGFTVTIAFHRDDESQLFRQQFAETEP